MSENKTSPDFTRPDDMSPKPARPVCIDNLSELEQLEELVLKESILNATGLNVEKLQVGLKGDPSMRETTFNRKRYKSEVDDYFEQLIPHFTELLTERSTYRLYIGFNNGEIRTHSIFDPLRVEIHSAEKMADDSYFERQFPKIPYEEKMNTIRTIYKALEATHIDRYLPEYWKRVIKKRNANWVPMKYEEIPEIIHSLRRLRDIDEYYLRNISICTIQDFVRTQFNCDGTQLIKSKNYKTFLEQNIP